MNDKNISQTPPGNHPDGGDDDQGPSGVFILVTLALIALACIGGYFFVMKLIDISRQEDCFLAGRSNCAPITVPSGQ
jgi:hypothetical protein